MKPDFGIFLSERKVVQFFADKAVLFLSYLVMGFILIDSFINLLPTGHGTMVCFIKNNSVTSGQQSYVNEYCTGRVPGATYTIPILIFGQGLLSVLLHYSWYAMVLYVSSNVGSKQKKLKKAEEDDKKKKAEEDDKKNKADKEIAEADKIIAKVGKAIACADK